MNKKGKSGMREAFVAKTALIIIQISSISEAWHGNNAILELHLSDTSLRP